MTDGPNERVGILFFVEAFIFINTSVFHIFQTYILLDISDQECPTIRVIFFRIKFMQKSINCKADIHKLIDASRDENIFKKLIL